MRRLQQLIKNNRGQAMVEFAFVLPVLLLILCGIIEYGRIFHETLVVTAAAREGARAAAVGNDGKAMAASYAATINRGQLDVTVKVTPNPQPVGSSVTVTVTNTVPILTPVMAVIYPSDPVVQGVATMRVE